MTRFNSYKKSHIFTDLEQTLTRIKYEKDFYFRVILPRQQYTCLLLFNRFIKHAKPYNIENKNKEKYPTSRENLYYNETLSYATRNFIRINIHNNNDNKVHKHMKIVGFKFEKYIEPRGLLLNVKSFYDMLIYNNNLGCFSDLPRNNFFYKTLPISQVRNRNINNRSFENQYNLYRNNVYKGHGFKNNHEIPVFQVKGGKKNN